MEQILLNQLTSLKRSSLRIILRCSSKKIPFYRGQILQAFINNNINLEIVDDQDEMFPIQKVQVISQSQLSNGIKNQETIFNGTYSSAFVEYIVIVCKQKLFFRECDIDMNLKFKIEPIIRFKNNFDSKRINRKRNQRQKKQSQIHKLCQQQQDQKNVKIERKSTRSNFNGKSSPRNDEDIDRDTSQYHGRRCFCCSNRSPQESELTLSRSFSRSPMKKNQNGQIKEHINKQSNFLNEKRICNNLKNQEKINAIQRGKSSQSDRKQKSNNYYLYNHLQTSANQQRQESLLKSPNKIQFRNLNKRRQNETCSESNNKWIKTKRQDDAFSRASQYEQDKKTQPKVNLQAKKQQKIKISRNPMRQTLSNQKSSKNPFYHSATIEGEQKSNLNPIKSAKTSFIHIPKQIEQRFSQMGATAGFMNSDNQRKINLESKTGRINQSKKNLHQRKSSLEDSEANLLMDPKIFYQPYANKMKPQDQLTTKNQCLKRQPQSQKIKVDNTKQQNERLNSRHEFIQQQKCSSGASKIRKIPLNQKMQMIKQMQTVKANQIHEDPLKVKLDVKKSDEINQKQKSTKASMKKQSQKQIDELELKESKSCIQSKQIQVNEQIKGFKYNEKYTSLQKNEEILSKYDDNQNDFSVTHQKLNDQHLQLSEIGSKFKDQSPNIAKDDLVSTRKEIKYDFPEDDPTYYEAAIPANINQVRDNASTHTSRTIPYNNLTELQNHLTIQNSLKQCKIRSQDEQQFFDELFMNNLQEEPLQRSENNIVENNQYSVRNGNERAMISSKEVINSESILQANKQMPNSRRNLGTISLNSDLTSEQKSQYSETSKLKIGQENRDKNSKSRISANSFQFFPANQQKVHSSVTEILQREEKMQDQCSSQPCKSFESLQRFEKQLFEQQHQQSLSSKKLQKSESYKLNKANIKDFLRLDTIDEVNESIYRKNQKQLSKDSISLNTSKIGSSSFGPVPNLKQVTSITQIKQQTIFEPQHNVTLQKQNSQKASIVQNGAPQISNTPQHLELCSQSQKNEQLLNYSNSSSKSKQNQQEVRSLIYNQISKDQNPSLPSKSIFEDQISKPLQAHNIILAKQAGQGEYKNQITENALQQQSQQQRNHISQYKIKQPLSDDILEKKVHNPNDDNIINAGQSRQLREMAFSSKNSISEKNELYNTNQNYQFVEGNKQSKLTATLSDRNEYKNFNQDSNIITCQSKDKQSQIQKINLKPQKQKMNIHGQENYSQVLKQNEAIKEQRVEHLPSQEQNCIHPPKKSTQADQENNSYRDKSICNIIKHQSLQQKPIFKEQNIGKSGQIQTSNDKIQAVQQKLKAQQILLNQSFQTDNKQNTEQPKQAINFQERQAAVHDPEYQNMDKQKFEQIKSENEVNKITQKLIQKQYRNSPPVQSSKIGVKNDTNKSQQAIKSQTKIQSKQSNSHKTIKNAEQMAIANPIQTSKNNEFANEHQKREEQKSPKKVNKEHQKREEQKSPKKVNKEHQKREEQKSPKKVNKEHQKREEQKSPKKVNKEHQKREEQKSPKKVNKSSNTQIASIQVQTDYFLPIDEGQGDHSEPKIVETQTNKISSVHSEKKKCKISLCDPQIFHPNIESASKKTALKRKNRNKVDKDNEASEIPLRKVQVVDQLAQQKDQIQSEEIEQTNNIMSKTKLGQALPLEYQTNQYQKKQVQNFHQAQISHKHLEIANPFHPKQLHLNFESFQQQSIGLKTPSILDRLIYRKFKSIVFQAGQNTTQGKQGKIELINNSLEFIRRALPWLQSELINSTKTSACLFINNQWILFTSKQRNQYLNLAQLLLVNLQQASVFRCIQMLTGMPLRILKDKQRSSDNKRLLKSVSTLLQKRQEDVLEKAYYGINKMNSQVVLLQKVRHFLDKQKQNKAILECTRINSSQKSQIFNLESQSIAQFVQLFLLQDPKYLLLELDKNTINTYEVELQSVILYISGNYKFNLYEETQRNQYKLVQQSYMWIKHKNQKNLAKYLLVIEPIPSRQGQSALTMRLATSSKQGSKTNRIVKYESGGESKQFKGGYENKKNLYLPVVKEISKKQK